MNRRDEYAGFWRRLAAHALDVFIIFMFAALLSLFITMAELALHAPVHKTKYFNFFTGLMIGFLYNPLLESSSYQATLGKKALGLRVVDENELRIGIGQAFGRYFAKFLSSLLFGLGYLMIGWTDRRQGLHDKIAGTYVMRH